MKRNEIISYILFFIFFNISINFIIFREDPYMRPFIYFFCLSFMISLIVYQIFFNEKGKHHKLLIFGEILIISLSFVFSQQLLFQTPLSRDPSHHLVVTEKILDNFSIPFSGDFQSLYFKMPIFHLLITNGILITGLTYKWAQIFLISLPTLISLLIMIWLLSNKLFKSYEISFLSLIFVAIADNVLDMLGKNIVPNTIGIAIVLVIIYFSIFYYDKKYVIILLFILSIILVLTHTICFSLLIFQIVLLAMISKIYHEPRKFYFYSLFLIFLILIGILEWLFYSGFYFNSLLTIFKQLFIYGVDNIEQYSEKIPSNISFIDIIKARAGMVVLTLFSGLGVLIALKNHFRSSLVVTAAIITGGMLLCYFTFFIPALSGITHRFWYYGEVLGAIFIAYFLVYLSKYFNKNSKLNLIYSSFLLIFMFVLSYLLMTASVANDDNPLVPEYTIRTGWYDSEFSAGLFLINFDDDIPILADIDYSSRLKSIHLTHNNLKHRPPLMFISTNPLENSIKNNCYFVSRIRILEYRYFFLNGRGERPLQEKTNEFISYLKNNGNLLYSNPTTMITHHGIK